MTDTIKTMTGVSPIAEEVAYARSTDKAELEFQVELFDKRGIPAENIWTDRAAPKRNLTRLPGLKHALMLMEGRPGWTLVVYKLDRLGIGVKQLRALHSTCVKIRDDPVTDFDPFTETSMFEGLPPTQEGLPA